MKYPLFSFLLWLCILPNTACASSADIPFLRNCLNTANQMQDLEARETQTVQCLWDASAYINERLTQLNRKIHINKPSNVSEAKLMAMRADIEKYCTYNSAQSIVDDDHHDIQQAEAILCMLERYEGLVKIIENAPATTLEGLPPKTLSGEFYAEELGAAGFLRWFASYFASTSEHQYGVDIDFDNQWVIIGTGNLDGYGGHIEHVRYNPQTGKIAFETMVESGSGNGERYPLKARGIIRQGVMVLDIDFQSDKAQRTVLFLIK